MARGQKPFVSVVTSVKNEERTIAKLLDSILVQKYPKDRYEVIVVDAVSTDRTAQIVREYAAKGKAPAVKLLVRPGPDVAGGRNAGVRAAKGEFVHITDGDMVLSPTLLEELVGTMQQDDTIGGAGGPNESATHDLTSRTISCFPVHGPSLGVVPLTGKNRYDRPFATSTDVYACVCRNAMFRRSAMEKVGLFDERLIATEDPEFNMRLLKGGWKLAYNPKAGVLHHHRPSLKSFFFQQGRYAYWQAVVNKRHPEMRSPRQPLPAIALASLAALLSIATFLPGIRLAAIVLLVLALLAPLAYGLKCAVAKRDSVLLATVPVFFLAWMLGWALEYPLGALGVEGGREGGRFHKV